MEGGLFILKKKCFLFFCLFLLILPGGCEKKEEKKSVPFTICEEKEIPDEVREKIEEKKESPFRFTFENSASLYLVVGYGKQKNGEYVAAVKEVYETGSGIYADTVLITLSYADDRNTGEASSCPYVVIKCEKSEKMVFFS